MTEVKLNIKKYDTDFIIVVVANLIMIIIDNDNDYCPALVRCSVALHVFSFHSVWPSSWLVSLFQLMDILSEGRSIPEEMVLQMIISRLNAPDVEHYGN